MRVRAGISCGAELRSDRVRRRRTRSRQQPRQTRAPRSWSPRHPRLSQYSETAQKMSLPQQELFTGEIPARRSTPSRPSLAGSRRGARDVKAAWTSSNCLREGPGGHREPELERPVDLAAMGTNCPPTVRRSRRTSSRGASELVRTLSSTKGASRQLDVRGSGRSAVRLITST